MDNKSLDIPYSDSFLVREYWSITSPNEYDRCLVKVSMSVEFLKSTFFQGKIQSRAEAGMLENTENWF